MLYTIKSERGDIHIGRESDFTVSEQGGWGALGAAPHPRQGPQIFSFLSIYHKTFLSPPQHTNIQSISAKFALKIPCAS